MIQRILVATDGSAHSLRAIDTAIGMAVALRAQLVGCAAIPPYAYHGLSDGTPFGGEASFEAQAAAQANANLDAAEARCRAAGLQMTRIAREGSPHTAICQTADDEHCDLIVMASHGRRGLGALLLGSETQKVLTLARQPVLVVR